MKYQFKPSHVIPAFFFVVAVLYGGSKPPCPTNTPPQNANQHESGESPRMMLNRFASFRPIGENSRSASVTNWIARGAYCDRQRIDFPEAFRFPVGTNLVDAVTLFAWVEVRQGIEKDVDGLAAHFEGGVKSG